MDLSGTVLVNSVTSYSERTMSSLQALLKIMHESQNHAYVLESGTIPSVSQDTL